MVANVIVCPGCRRHLKVRGTWPTGKRVACPACGEPLLPVGASRIMPQASSERFFRAAITAALLFVGASIALAGWFNRPAGAAPPAAAVSNNAAGAPAPGWPTTIVRGTNPLPCPEAGCQIKEATETAASAPVAPPKVAVAPAVPVPDTTVTPLVVSPQLGYAERMNQAAVALLDGRYNDAHNYYAEALDLAPPLELAAAAACRPTPSALFAPVPGHGFAWRARRAPGPACVPTAQPTPSASSAALEGLRQAGYSQAMAAGDADMRAQHYDAAVSAFQDALRNRPGDRTAASCLIQARALAL